MGNSITSANAVYLLAVTDLFNVPQPLQGYTADDIFSQDARSMAETNMGMDGKLSAGYVPMAVVQNIMLQANSESCDVFDEWNRQETLTMDKFFAQGTVVLKSIKRRWTLQNGVLTTVSPMPDAARILRPRRFTLTWEKVTPTPYVQ